MAKPVLVSGIQPSGRMHIGNYLGALKNFVELQNSGKYQCYFFIADLHSLTSEFEPKQKAKQILELFADFLAIGLDPKKSTIFLQSRIPAHSELAWVFNTITPLGELKRMTQFKDKASRQTGEGANEAEDMLHTSANAGLLVYPTLMAADILLYNANFVPVGDDQLQHLELTRTVARKFNGRFGKTFTEPKPILTEATRVMSLGEPGKKMSKSIPFTCLFMDDSPEDIAQKVKRAVTDSGAEIKFDKDHKPAVSNLLTIYSSLSGLSIQKLEKEFAGHGYGEFKSKLAELITDHFADFRKKKKALLSKPTVLKAALAAGSKKATKTADAKVGEVKKKIGLAL